jgi:hypothetical protein
LDTETKELDNRKKEELAVQDARTQVFRAQAGGTSCCECLLRHYADNLVVSDRSERDLVDRWLLYGPGPSANEGSGTQPAITSPV